MYITVTEGYYRHGKPAGSGVPRLVRLASIEEITQESELWLGESDRLHVCSHLYLSTMRNAAGVRPLFGGRGGSTGGSIAVRETVAEIAALIAAAMPRHTALHDHVATVRISGQVGHEVDGAVEHVHIAAGAPVIPPEASGSGMISRDG